MANVCGWQQKYAEKMCGKRQANSHGHNHMCQKNFATPFSQHCRRLRHFKASALKQEVCRRRRRRRRNIHIGTYIHIERVVNRPAGLHLQSLTRLHIHICMCVCRHTRCGDVLCPRGKNVAATSKSIWPEKIRLKFHKIRFYSHTMPFFAFLTFDTFLLFLLF